MKMKTTEEWTQIWPEGMCNLHTRQVQAIQLDAIKEGMRRAAEELNVTKQQLYRAIEACQFMHDDPPKGMSLGDELTSKGVTCLNKEYNELKVIAHGLAEFVKHIGWTSCEEGIVKGAEQTLAAYQNFTVNKT